MVIHFAAFLSVDVVEEFSLIVASKNRGLPTVLRILDICKCW